MSKHVLFIALVACSFLSHAQKALPVIKIAKPFPMELPVPQKNHNFSKPRVIESSGKTQIEFSYPPASTPPRDSKTLMTIEHLKDVVSLDKIYEHFNAREHQKFTAAEFEKYQAVKRISAPAGTIVIIDNSQLGSAPGTQFAYVLSKDGKFGSLLMAPIDYLTFDWDLLKVEWH